MEGNPRQSCAANALVCGHLMSSATSHFPPLSFCCNSYLNANVSDFLKQSFHHENASLAGHMYQFHPQILNQATSPRDRFPKYSPAYRDSYIRINPQRYADMLDPSSLEEFIKSGLDAPSADLELSLKQLTPLTVQPPRPSPPSKPIAPIPFTTSKEYGHFTSSSMHTFRNANPAPSVQLSPTLEKDRSPRRGMPQYGGPLPFGGPLIPLMPSIQSPKHNATASGTLISPRRAQNLNLHIALQSPPIPSLPSAPVPSSPLSPIRSPRHAKEVRMREPISSSLDAYPPNLHPISSPRSQAQPQASPRAKSSSFSPRHQLQISPSHSPKAAQNQQQQQQSFLPPLSSPRSPASGGPTAPLPLAAVPVSPNGNNFQIPLSPPSRK